MKITSGVIVCVCAGLLALAGCGKPKTETPVQQGVAIDLPKLQEAFAAAGPELQTLAGEVSQRMRYGEYPAALAALDKLANNASLTEPQKKIVAAVTEQVKAVASKAPAPAR